MDAKSLAKSKRAHSQHHKKHHPNIHKVKGPTSSVGASGTNKVVKDKPRESQGSSALPSNWDRYEDEYDNSMTGNQIDGQSNQQIDAVVPKSKGADYAYLISEAKSQNSTRPSSEIFPSLDDFVTDFGQGIGSFFAVRGESILSSIQNDSFIVEDKATASYEASFLSLDLRALSEQLAKIDLPKRLFMEADFFPPEQYSEREQEPHNSSQAHGVANKNELQASYETTKSHHHNSSQAHGVANKNELQASYETTKSHHRAIQDHSSQTHMNPMVHHTPISNPSENLSKFKPQTAEAELDMLLDSFADTTLTDSMGSNTIAIDIDGTLDDLLKETSAPVRLGQNIAPSAHEVKPAPLGFKPSSSQPVSKSKLLDDFDSWLDTI